MVSEGYWSFELIGAVFELKFKAKSLVWNAAKQWIFVFLFDFQFGQEKTCSCFAESNFSLILGCKFWIGWEWQRVLVYVTRTEIIRYDIDGLPLNTANKH